MPPPAQSYREIPLTYGQVALVSAHRFEYINQFRWKAVWSKCTKSWYACRCGTGAREGKQTIRMHREILGLAKGDRRTGDHINHDTLDNRDENLRIATHGQNNQNQGKKAHNTSGYKGVSWHKKTRMWQARIGVDGKRRHLGIFSTAKDAHAAYCQASEQFHGEFANFG